MAVMNMALQGTQHGTAWHGTGSDSVANTLLDLAECAAWCRCAEKNNDYYNYWKT
jgi:hypothetical protein